MARRRFFSELDETRTELISMGETAESALAHSLRALLSADRSSAEKARTLEPQIDAMNKSIRRRCLELVALEAPVASDARLITAMLEAIVDLEQIGDYAEDIAELALGLEGKTLPPLLGSFERLAARVCEMLSAALDSWRTMDRDLGLSVRSLRGAVDNEYRSLFEELRRLLTTHQDGVVPLSLVLTAKYLDRVARHAVSLAEQAASAASFHGQPVSDGAY
jgi:phosphate transport system protein